jgi:hypothetical protein
LKEIHAGVTGEKKLGLSFSTIQMDFCIISLFSKIEGGET